MLRDFKVIKVNNLNETLQLINSINEPYRFICGGTDVLVKAKDNPSYAKLLVDISSLAELTGIEERKSTFVIGSGVRHLQLIKYPAFNKDYSALVQAVSNIGSPQIRALGTLGGNIGNASPAGDSIPALMVFDADIEVRSLNSNRTIRLQDFFKGPGRTVLEKNEIITKIVVPKFEGYKSGWKRLGQRSGFAISKVSSAAALSYSTHPNGSLKLTDIKIALGAVAPTVIRAAETEKFMKAEQTLTKSMLKKACDILKSEIKPISDVRSNAEYRTAMAAELFSQIVEETVTGLK
ncbi:MAG: xanthine dehydrogenase family protein subunit M [Candidatus Wallbacteria bacterium]